MALDVSVEEAELKRSKRRPRSRETMLARHERLKTDNATTDMAVDRARAERDVALAQIGTHQGADRQEDHSARRSARAWDSPTFIPDSI